MGEAFYWIGLIFTATLCLLGLLIAVLWLYFTFVHGRFSAILFRRGERRLFLMLGIMERHRHAPIKGKHP